MLVALKKHLESILKNYRKNKKYNYIYICHTKKDEDFARKTINLLLEIGVQEEYVLSTSIENYTVPLEYKNNSYEYMRNILEQNILVLFLLSNDTYTDPLCMMDMGAVWVLKRDYYSIISPDFETVPNGAINPSERSVDIRYDDSSIKVALGQFKERIETSFLTKKISAARWEEKRDEYIDELKILYSGQLKEMPLSDDAERVVESLKEKTKFSIAAVVELGYTEKRSIEIINYLLKNRQINKESVGRFSWTNKI